MKIEMSKKAKCFCEISPGEVFRWNGEFYIKLTVSRYSPEEIPNEAVNLETGQKRLFHNSDKVLPVKATLKIED